MWPHWPDPCWDCCYGWEDDPDGDHYYLKGCLEADEDDKLWPRLIESAGKCDYDKVGCHFTDSGKKWPRLVLTEHDSLQEHRESCCRTCRETTYWPCGHAPRYIEVTFADIEYCTGCPDGGNGANPNQTFVLEQTEYCSCCWNIGGDGYYVMAEISGGYIIVGADFGHMTGVNWPAYCSDDWPTAPIGFYQSSVWGEPSTYLLNSRTIGQCQSCSGAGRGFCYGGEATIEWDPE